MFTIRIFCSLFLLTSLILAGCVFLFTFISSDIDTAFTLLGQAKGLLVVGLLAVILTAGLSIFFHLLWLKALRKLESDINEITKNPEQILPQPKKTQYFDPVYSVQTALHNLHSRIRHSIRQRQRLADIGEAVTKINHDLRNMLSSVTLVTDQLENSQDPKVAQIAPVVINATRQATDLCQNMLNYLADYPDPQEHIINMDELTAELQAGTELQLIYSGPDIVKSDRLMLYRIFINLLRNARHVGAKQVTIDIWQAGHLAVIDISDNGPGVHPDVRDRLFAPFASGTSTHTGLGLAICLDLAIALGGQLSLSHSSDPGCEFRLQLPADMLACP